MKLLMSILYLNWIIGRKSIAWNQHSNNRHRLLKTKHQLENIMKSSILNYLSIACIVLGTAGTASAESFRTVNADDGTVYQIDLDTRSEYTTDSGWRHVQFWLSTAGDPNKHRVWTV